ncbi:helix-hairpin-helix domain-containing protein [Actinomadura viridis]|uniref:Exodeoxyribonuclease V alpha subunit n=1 Tax=Actinomadura viridis TaxID=58110 RepID=A0A931DIM0_9ACTN|nr:helix-hairpin-helix domain-containing protein [Actinomadura viridis]MBG6090052.1 exodeoxyribonuclease V alpha subunit [Actinomadura viridis]
MTESHSANPPGAAETAAAGTPGAAAPGASETPGAAPAGAASAAGRAALAELFDGTGVPVALVHRTLARLGTGAAGLLREDPWRLLRVPGVTPRQADHFARRALGDQARPDDRRRGRALVAHLLTEAARHGHTVTPPAEVLSALEGLGVPDPRRAVEDALDAAEAIALTEEADFDEAALEDGDLDEIPEPEETLGLARWALAEEAAAEGLRRLAATAAPLLDDAAVKAARAGLPEDRSLAVTAAFGTGVSILRGTADDLSRTALGIAGIAAAHGLRAAVVTPTDRAAADLAAQAPEAPAFTIAGLHTLLEPREGAGGPEAAPGTVVFGRGEQRPLEPQLLVLTDGAGLDVELCAVLVEACADGTHLVLGGEPQSLPPAGPGRPLDDLEASETVAVIELEPDAPAAPPAVLTAAVRGGELVTVDAPGKEVVIVPADGATEAVHRTVQLVTDSIPRALGIPVEDVQVVAPAAGGEAGTAALNAALKARLNPGPGAFGGFDPGDRVLVAAPLPYAAVGEAGTVTGADPAGLHVEFAGGTAVVPPALTSRLRPGWAVTVALGRGTRRPAVVAVLPPATAGDDGALTRPLVATAFGLARRHLSVVQASGPALAAAVRERPAPARRTRLAALVVQ